MTKPHDHSNAALAADLLPLLEALGNVNLLALGRLLRQRFEHDEAFVTVVGETSAGKSTLINGLLTDVVLPTSARPTTGTVVHVVCAGVEGPRFLAIDTDATQASVSAAEFARLCATPDESLLRLQLWARPRSAEFIGLHVFDTPGYNALTDHHEEVLRRILPESDVVVFVCGYKSGFGQVEQDLYELTASATGSRRSLPFLLVINRVPPGITEQDKRVREIVRNATDSLKRTPHAILIGSAAPGSVDASPFWGAVAAEVRSGGRQRAVAARLGELLAALIEEASDEARRRVATATATTDEFATVREQLADFREALEQSLGAVERTRATLHTLLPRSVDRGAEKIRKDLVDEIAQSDKWLGKDPCIEWIQAHALPFAVRACCQDLERLIAEELERLDRELADIANTTRERILQRIHVKSDASARLAESLARSFAKKAGGTALTSVLGGFGGVGGVAAGAGNLVKMAVKQIGRLVGATFGREVYQTIGRLFTKRFVAIAGGVLTVAVDGAIFVVDANRWQGQLQERVAEAIGKWREEIKEDLVSRQVPEISAANERSVREVYESEIERHLETLAQQGAGRDREVANWQELLVAFERLGQCVSTPMENL